jgi:ribosomal protein S18 acetylase RimI-like enzyme
MPRGNDRRPKYLQVCDLLTELVGQLGPGAALPSERELSALFGVSRSTVRRTVENLRREQHLGRWLGSGRRDGSAPEVHLRTGRADDADRLAAVFASAWRGAYPGIVSEESLRRLDGDDIATWLRTLVGSRRSTTVVAESDDGELLGFCRFGRDVHEAMIGHVFSLYVSPDASRRGLGRRLLEHALEQLDRRGLNEVTLWVFEQNEVARSFYAAFAFAPDGARRVEPAYGAEELRLRRCAKAEP